MKTTLERRILLFSFLALSLTIAVNTGFNVESFHRSYRDGVLKRCETLAQGLKRPIENIINLGIPLAEIDGLSERCNNVVQNDPEIAYCLIEDADGTMLYSSDEPYPRTSDVSFVGQLSPDVSILEDPLSGRLYDYSLPIYDFEDQVTGRIRIGFQKAILDVLTVNHFLWSMLVLGVAFIVVFALTILFARSSLVKPIRKLCNMAREVSSGNFQAEPPELKTNELAILSDSLSEMARSLYERDQQIRSSYEELEETNLELQKSYENLESLSSELGRSREMYRSLLDDASDAILVCNESDDLILVNKAAERFFAMPRQRIEGRNYFSFLESVHCPDIEQVFDRHHKVAPGHSINSEIRFWRAKDQRKLLGWATSCAIVGKDNKRFVQVIVRDATNEEEIRLNLQKTADEMARLNQMKNSFLGLASHELKTPLTIIMGYVELLTTEMADRLDRGSLEMIEHISKASNRLSDIIRDMVDVSLLDNQTIELASKPIMINALIENAVEKLRPFIAQRKQFLHLGLADDLPPIKCDVERMLQVLNNILGNAIKFTPDSGHVTIQTRHVRRPRIPAKFAQNGNSGACLLSGEKFSYIEISIADTGIGIAEDDQEAIFDKFYEVGKVEEHSSGKVAFKSRGAGLGLTVVKGIVALHGGAVWAESPGNDPEALPGSTFYVLLPVQEDLSKPIVTHASV